MFLFPLKYLGCKGLSSYSSPGYYLSIGHLRINFGEIWIKIQQSSLPLCVLLQERQLDHSARSLAPPPVQYYDTLLEQIEAVGWQQWVPILLILLTLNILDCFEDYKRCIHLSYHILDFVQQKKTKFTMEQPYMLYILQCQYHACWCPGDLRSQGTSRHGIDQISQSIPSLAPEELTCVSQWYVCSPSQGVILGAAFRVSSNELQSKTKAFFTHSFNSLWPSDAILAYI